MNTMMNTNVTTAPLFAAFALSFAVPTANAQYTKEVYIPSRAYERPGGERKSMLTINSGRQLNTLFNKISKEINSYSSLREDWDGYGGTAPTNDVIALSLNFLSIINSNHLPLPKPMVSGDGAVSLYWEDKEASIYVEVAFDESNSYSYIIKNSEDMAGEDDIDLSVLGIKGCILDTIRSIPNSRTLILA
jgi:hypothetical protein